jgi:hypothetical protein
MREISVKFPGKVPRDIMEKFRTSLWDRRREITESETIDEILGAVSWDPAGLKASGAKRIMMLKSAVDVCVEGEELKVKLTVPVQKYEEKYAERIEHIMKTLFEA